jgi:energy-coupling factor transport system substrate-specific component
MMKRAPNQQLSAIDSKHKQPVASAWNIGRREVVAAILGVILYGFLSHVSLVVLISANTPDVFLPALLIPLLFGVIYGPWVGLIVGGFGFLLGDYIANALLTNLFWDNGYLFFGNFYGNSLAGFRDLVGWNGIPGYMANAVIGMIAGLTTVGTRQRFTTLYSLALVGIVSAVGIVIATAIVVYSAVLIYQTPYYRVNEATLAFFDTVLPNLVIALVLLPLLLWIFGALARWRTGGI